MLISLHKNARTTPAIRAEIAASSCSDTELMAQYGVSRDTIQKWRHRESTADLPHTAHRLQTTLNAGQEELVVYLRRQLQLPLDDLLAVIHEFIDESLTRSALHRLLVRRGVSRLPQPEVQEAQTKKFKAYMPGYVHMDVKYLPQMMDETSRRYVFVAIDRATRWVFIAIKKDKSARSARAFLNELNKASAFKIKTLLTDNGKEFTDRLFGKRAKDVSGAHQFDQLCQALGIEHRLTKPKTPKTNGMVERFNGRLAQILNTHRFDSAMDLEQTLHRYVWLYNQQFPQKALDHRCPIESMKEWQKSNPELFVKKIRNRPGLDT
jgi:transposase InsO family protein